jgi:DNA-directed RNA polymerase specialized sigma24 family protein
MVRLIQFALRGAVAADREAFILHALEGFSAEEIASITDRKLEQVHQAISRTREQLRHSFPSNSPFNRKMTQHTGTR